MCRLIMPLKVYLVRVDNVLVFFLTWNSRHAAGRSCHLSIIDRSLPFSITASPSGLIQRVSSIHLHTVDESLVCYRTDMETQNKPPHAQSRRRTVQRLQLGLVCVALDCCRKLEQIDRSHTNTGRTANYTYRLKYSLTNSLKRYLLEYYH